MSDCRKIRERLATDGGTAAGDERVARHLEGCADCRAYLATLREIEAGLGALDLPDAPDALAEKTLAAVRAAGKAPAGRPRRRRRSMPWILGGVAASLVGVVATGIFVNAFLANKRSHIAEIYSEAPQRAAPSGDASALVENEVAAEKEYKSKERGFVGGDFGDGEGAGAFAGAGRASETSDYAGNEMDIVAMLDPEAFDGRGNGAVAVAQDKKAQAIQAVPGVVAEGHMLNTLDLAEEVAEAAPPRPPKPEEQLGENSKRDRDANVMDAPMPGKMPRVDSLQPQQVYGNRQNAEAVADDDSRAKRAAAYLSQQRALDGLVFQDPAGYWANTYIPGDPSMRLVAAQLRDWGGYGYGLASEVQPVRQPFDAPENAALAVYLNADAAAIDGPSRLRIQVGLKGAERQGGRRPAMNVGLVVDLRVPPSPEAGARIRALITALEEARQPDDRFSLIVAGPGGGLVTAPEDFRHGPLRVAMERMFGGARQGLPGTGLHEAIALAAATVSAGDDPSSVLGSSLVLMATGSALNGELGALEDLAHRNAVAGIPLSIVGLAAGEDLAQIDRLVAAGQGNRRILESAQAADSLVDRELHAASRAVARAVRLRIRLAPGVKLVGILGSHRLAEPQAQRVREAEQSIDQRLSRNLGIKADRGEDEEGIQIVIPAFQAGDDHVILLDVVAERAGPLADVTVRYKDVIHLKNGVARASLSVARGEAEPGPLELNVLKNLVAQEYARQVRQAGLHLAAGDQAAARATIEGLDNLMTGLQVEMPGWRGDPDLAADIALLHDYMALLYGPASADAMQRDYVAASLRYMAFRKIQAERR